MIDLEAMAEHTCRELLAVRELKAICRWRGLGAPPRTGKEALAAFVAPRLLESAGVAEAMASLDKTWLIVLHWIAMVGEPVQMRDFASFVEPRVKAWEIDDRHLFRKVAAGLLSRGVVLCEDRSDGSRRTNRFARLVLHLPEAHRLFMPPYPLPSTPLARRVRSGDPLAFCRNALQAAARGSRASGAEEDLPNRVAAAISFEGGKLTLGKRPPADSTVFLKHVRAEWVKGGTGEKRTKSWRQTLQDALHILAHLPQGHGVAASDLEKALRKIGSSIPRQGLTPFLEEGTTAGLLRRAGTDPPCYAGAAVSVATGRDRPLVFKAKADWIEVDPTRSGLDSLLELASVSRVEPVGTRLRFSPDVVLLGRSASRLDSLASLGAAQEASAAFRKAVEHVRGRDGKLLLHQGLLVLRVEDLGLRTALAHHLGDRIRPLAGAFLAAPRNAADEVEKIVRREGFSPRKVSCQS